MAIHKVGTGGSGGGDSSELAARIDKIERRLKVQPVNMQVTDGQTVVIPDTQEDIAYNFDAGGEIQALTVQLPSVATSRPRQNAFFSTTFGIITLNLTCPDVPVDSPMNMLEAGDTIALIVGAKPSWSKITS